MNGHNAKQSLHPNSFFLYVDYSSDSGRIYRSIDVIAVDGRVAYTSDRALVLSNFMI